MTPGARATRGALLAAAAIVLASCRSSAATPPAPEPGAGGPAARQDASARSPDAWADSVLATLTLREKAAQLVWPWTLGDYVGGNTPAWTKLEAMAREHGVGGYIMSIGSPTEIAVKLNALQRASKVPLLIGADLETGAAFRVRGGVALPNILDLGAATWFPLMMGLGATGDTALAYQYGRVTAREGRALGMHMAFAPVLDVNNNPGNPVIGARSLGEDPRHVARMGVALIRGIQDNGMLATGKHFPGHGDTETNSHLALARVDATRARLDSVELLPFKAAVDAGVRGIMTFHGVLPGLDTAQVAATLNPRIMTQLLREQMGFRGILVTDALDMNGVGAISGAEVVIRALEAGNDVLLMPTDLVGAIDAVTNAVRTGRVTEERLNRSVRLLLRTKAEMGLHRQRYVDVDSIRHVVADTAHQAVARTVAERAITLVKDSLSVVPFAGRGRATKVASITFAPRNEFMAGATFDTELRTSFPELRSVQVTPEVVYETTAGAAAGTGGGYHASPTPRVTPAHVENVMRAAEGADLVIVSSYFNVSTTTAAATTPPGFPELVQALAARKVPVVVLTFGNPYILRDIPTAPAYLIAWGPTAVSQRAAARALLGLAPITGTLPTTIPGQAAVGAGIRRTGAIPVRKSSP